MSNSDKNKKNKNSDPFACRMGTVGGQAVLEGIMMKSKEDYCVAVRREDGTVSLSSHKSVSLRKKHKIFRLPLIRGIVSFVESMILSYKTLSISAEQYGLDDIEPETKTDKWIVKNFGDKLMPIIMTISAVFGIILGLGLFFFLPAWITKGVERLIGSGLGLLKNLIEGIIKIAIFVGYILLVSLMKDIRKTFEYHGAEHKSIFCYEQGEELTVENIKKQKRFHPRCGTSFIFVILIISILVSSLPFITWDNMLLRSLTKLLMLPVIVGIGFEFIMYAGKHDNGFTKIVSAPGLWMQRITTKEPDDGQIEVAIIALKSALPDVFPEYHYIDPHDAVQPETSDSVTGREIPDDAAQPESPENAADAVVVSDSESKPELSTQYEDEQNAAEVIIEAASEVSPADGNEANA